MNDAFKSALRALRGGTALHALALVGAGVGMAAIAAPAVAQDYTTGAITGSVVDADGKAVPGAQVTLRSQAQGQERTLTASGSGSFNAVGLVPGTYNVTVSANGYRDLSDTLTIAAAQENRVTLTVVSASAAADVVVTGQRVRQDFTKSTGGLNIDVPALTANVPLARSSTALILLAPGTTQGVSGFGDVASIGGSSVAENAYYINGLNITNPDTYVGGSRVPFDFYKTFDVQTFGYAAEFGRATGGVINATTKSGTNEPMMAMHGNFTPAFLQSANRNVGNATNLTTIGNLARDSAYQYTAEAGGALIKDHLFFYGLGTINYSTIKRAFGTAGTYSRTESTTPFFGGKVDAYLTSTQHLEFTYFNTVQIDDIYNFGFTPSVDGLGGTIGAASGTQRRHTGGINYVARYTGNVTDFFQISGAYGLSKDSNDLSSPNNSAYYVIDRRGTATANGTARVISTTQPYTNNSVDDTRRRFYRVDGDLRFDIVGRHHVRFGLDNEDLSETKVLQLNGALPIQYDYRSNPSGVRLTYEVLGGQISGQDRAYYLQDSWEPPIAGLTLNLGIRDDEFKQSNLLGQQYLKLTGNIAARAGFSYTPNGDSKVKFSGSYGRYYIPPAMNLGFRGKDLYFREYFRYPTGYNATNFPVDPTTGLPLIAFGAPLTGVAGFGTTCPTVNISAAPGSPTNPAAGIAACTVFGAGVQDPAAAKLAQGTKATYEDEFALSTRYQVTPLLSVGLSAIYRKLERISEDTDFSPYLYDYFNCNTPTATTATSCNFYNANSAYIIWNPGSSSLTVRDFANTNNVVTLTGLTFPKPKRDYKAITFDWKRADDGKWSWQGSVTVSRSYGNYEGTVKSDAGNSAQTDAGATQDFDYLGLTDNSTGILPNDHTFSLKTFASYHLASFLTIGANLLVQSPYRQSCQGIHPTDPNAAGYGASSFFCAVNLQSNGNYATTVAAPRGTGIRSDWLKQFDLAIRVTAPPSFGLGKNFTIRADVFNVLNSHATVQNYTQHETGSSSTGYAPDPLYGTPLVYQAPRSVRLGFDLAF